MARSTCSSLIATAARAFCFGTTAKGTVYGPAFADFDGDGWPDIVAARFDAPNAIWFSTKPGGGR